MLREGKEWEHRSAASETWHAREYVYIPVRMWLCKWRHTTHRDGGIIKLLQCIYTGYSDRMGHGDKCFDDIYIDTTIITRTTWMDLLGGGGAPFLSDCSPISVTHQTLIGLKLPRVAACIHITYIYTCASDNTPYKMLCNITVHENGVEVHAEIWIGMYISDVVEWKRWQRTDMTEVVSFGNGSSIELMLREERNGSTAVLPVRHDMHANTYTSQWGCCCASGDRHNT